MDEHNSLIVTKLMANGRSSSFVAKICEMRRKYDILMELTTPEIITLQKDAILRNYMQGEGRLLVGEEIIRGENGNSVYKSIFKKDTKCQ